MRDHAKHLQVAYGSSERRACQVLTLGRSTYRYESVATEQAALRIRIRDLAAARVNYGYRRIHVLLRRAGWQVNHKRDYRLYRLVGLRMRTKRPKRHVSSQRRERRAVASEPDERWAMDFMRDELYNGPEFTSKALDHWAYLNGAELDFSRPGKPTDNAIIEVFIARFRAECLNESWFLSLDDAREKTEEWRRYYNGERPVGPWATSSQRPSP